MSKTGWGVSFFDFLFSVRGFCDDSAMVFRSNAGYSGDWRFRRDSRCVGSLFFSIPLERVIVFFPPIVFHVPAITFLGLWVLLQLHNATSSIIFEGTTIDVAWWAHLGGFVAGSVFVSVFLKRQEK